MARIEFLEFLRRLCRAADFWIEARRTMRRIERYPQRNGLYDMIRNDVADYGKRITPAEYAVTPERILGMDVREVMISKVLKKRGYATGVFGKWDGGQLKRYLPLRRGFDT